MNRPRVCWSRRGFLKAALATAAAPTIVPASALGLEKRPAPSDRITVGIVGVGSRGFNLLEGFGAEADAQIIAICDVDSLHYRDNSWGKGRAFGLQPAIEAVQARYARQKTGGDYRGCRGCSDFRELCAAKDIDALVITTTSRTGP